MRKLFIVLLFLQLNTQAMQQNNPAQPVQSPLAIRISVLCALEKMLEWNTEQCIQALSDNRQAHNLVEREKLLLLSQIRSGTAHTDQGAEAFQALTPFLARISPAGAFEVAASVTAECVEKIVSELGIQKILDEADWHIQQNNSEASYFAEIISPENINKTIHQFEQAIKSQADHDQCPLQ